MKIKLRREVVDLFNIYYRSSPPASAQSFFFFINISFAFIIKSGKWKGNFSEMLPNRQFVQPICSVLYLKLYWNNLYMAFQNTRASNYFSRYTHKLLSYTSLSLNRGWRKKLAYCHSVRAMNFSSNFFFLLQSEKLYIYTPKAQDKHCSEYILPRAPRSWNLKCAKKKKISTRFFHIYNTMQPYNKYKKQREIVVGKTW